MIFGKIAAGWLADRFGRRAVFAIGAFGSAVFLPVIVLYHSPANIVYLMTIFGFLYGIPYGVNATYMTESFEASIRGSAVGGAYNVGRLGAAIAPAAIGFIATDGSIGLGFGDGRCLLPVRPAAGALHQGKALRSAAGLTALRAGRIRSGRGIRASEHRAGAALDGFTQAVRRRGRKILRIPIGDVPE